MRWSGLLARIIPTVEEVLEAGEKKRPEVLGPAFSDEELSGDDGHRGQQRTASPARPSCGLARGRARRRVRGTHSARSRDRIREQVSAHAERGDAAMVCKAPPDQGDDFATVGANRRLRVTSTA